MIASFLIFWPILFSPLDFCAQSLYNMFVSNETFYRKGGPALVSPLSQGQLTALAASPLFLGVPTELLYQICACDGCTLEEFPAGASIYQPNQFRRSLGILLSGQVRVTKSPLTVSTLEPSALFGAAALYNDAPDYASTLIALSPCTALLITQELLDTLLGEQPVLRQNYLRYLSGRIRFLSARLQSLAAGGAEGKLCRYLLANLENGTLVCPATELAHRLGISRASLYRAFEALEASGLIQRHGKTITVPDLAALGSAL